MLNRNAVLRFEQNPKHITLAKEKYFDLETF